MTREEVQISQMREIIRNMGQANSRLAHDLETVKAELSELKAQKEQYV